MSNMNDATALRVPYSRAQAQYQTEYEPATGTLWGYFDPRGTPCFSLGLLKDIREHDAAFEANGGRIRIGDEWFRPAVYVAASRTPRVFNLGGDLALFVLLIKSRDRDALAHYARLCVDAMDARIRRYGRTDLTTISLVQGDALGGGFESALSSDVIVAEESAQMGLPEILFNLFPGMGAFSLLARRLGLRQAEELILSGRILPAAKLHEMGVVDVLAKDGEGEAAVREWIAGNARRRNGMQAVFAARGRVFPVTRDELDAIADIWVDAAFRLGERDLRMMGRIARAQLRRIEIGDVSDVAAAALAEDDGAARAVSYRGAR